MGESASDILNIRDEEGALLADFVKSIRTTIDEGDSAAIRATVADIHESDLADLLENLTAGERAKLIEAVGRDFDASVLVEVDESVRDEIVEQLPNEQIAEAVGELDSDDAVYLLEDMEAEDRAEILESVPADIRNAVVRSLEYPEDSAGRLMRQNFIHVPTFWTVGQTIDYLRDEDNLPEQFSEVFVTTPNLHLRGTVPLDRLLRSTRATAMESIMSEDRHLIDANLDQEELGRKFERYNLLSAPVVDDDRRLVGVVTVDDVVEVIQEEAEEDILRLGGVGDESIADTVWRTVYSRFAWLFINLLTAFLASTVIGLFDATIQQMVALAVLMPIVASMGGNAGTQTMTVTVRALATRDLGAANMMRVITRETVVGLINGMVFALIVALIALLWFDNSRLSFVFAAAMAANLLVAALAGILIPVVLDYFKVDPAVASSVFLTTVTDIVGFFSFLGLATLLLLGH